MFLQSLNQNYSFPTPQSPLAQKEQYPLPAPPPPAKKGLIDRLQNLSPSKIYKGVCLLGLAMYLVTETFDEREKILKSVSRAFEGFSLLTSKLTGNYESHTWASQKDILGLSPETELSRISAILNGEYVKAVQQSEKSLEDYQERYKEAQELPETLRKSFSDMDQLFIDHEQSMLYSFRMPQLCCQVAQTCQESISLYPLPKEYTTEDSLNSIKEKIVLINSPGITLNASQFSNVNQMLEKIKQYLVEGKECNGLFADQPKIITKTTWEPFGWYDYMTGAKATCTLKVSGISVDKPFEFCSKIEPFTLEKWSKKSWTKGNPEKYILHTILGLKPNYSKEELRKAYLAYSKEYHPDSIEKTKKTKQLDPEKIELYPTATAIYNNLRKSPEAEYRRNSH